MANLNLNKAILGGRITADIELKTSSSQKMYVNFTIAINNGSNSAQRTDFINIVAWDKKAELISRYFGKGECIALAGRISTRKYTAQDGSTRYVTEVIADEVFFVESKSDREAQTTAPAPATSAAVTPHFVDIDADDDLPF